MNATTPAAEWLQCLRPGARLHHGQYLIQKALGRGNRSWSYLAVDQHLNMPVVIKEYFPQGQCRRSVADGSVMPMGDAQYKDFMAGLRAFLEDARALALFNEWPGSITVHSLFKENGTSYLVTAYHAGQTLQEWLQAHTAELEWQEAIQIMAPVMETLQHMHAKGVFRGDIGPSVIFRTDEGRVLLLDYSAERHTRLPASEAGLERKTLPFDREGGRAAKGPWADVRAVAETLKIMLHSSRLVSGGPESQVPDGVRAVLDFAMTIENGDPDTSCHWLQQQLLAAAAGAVFEYPQAHLAPAALAAAPVAEEIPPAELMSISEPVENAVEDEAVEEETAPENQGASYEGQRRFGAKHGYGRQIYANGDVYEGDWRMGRRNGSGNMFYASGDEYSGEWKNDRRHGQGSLKTAAGSRYVGGWKEDQRSGKGKETLANGEKYIGEWKNDRRNGEGSEVFPNGDSYVGEWRGSLRNGQGSEVFANGDRYTGEWKADKRNGEGQEILSNGEEYVGHFKDGRRHGQGTVTRPGSEPRTGLWRNGRRLES